MDWQPFAPHFGSGQNLVIAAAGFGIVPITRGDDQLRVNNAGSGVIYLRTYDSREVTLTGAALTDYAVEPGQSSIITKKGHDTLAYLSAPGTTLHLCTGKGI